MLAYLRVKIKSLAEEARIIRNEEDRLKWRWDPTAIDTFSVRLDDGKWTPCVANGKMVKKKRTPMQEQVFWGLRNHRTHDVRREQRSTLLAYAFLRGKTYRSTERSKRKDSEPVDATRVAEMAMKYGTGVERLGNVKTVADMRTHVSAWLIGK